MKISVSILSAEDRINCIKKLNNTDIDYFHIDVMDGLFVDNYQMPINEVNELSNYTKKPLDIHLMVEKPLEYIKEIKNNNIRNITIHEEINDDIENLLKLIKEQRYKVGLAIKPNTNLNSIIKYLEYIDIILIMSVEPGYGGQEFLPSTIERIRELKEILKKYNKENIEIEIDGGINNKNINLLKKENVNTIVSGSYIVKSDNYLEKINILKN